MKKLFPLLSMLLLLASCTTEIDQQFGKMRSGAPGAKVVFQAAVEECTAPETKVYADESMKVLWNADDRISIFNQSTYNWQFAFEGDDGDTAGGFEPVGEGEPGSEMENVYAVYPYKSETALSTAGVLTTVLPAEQAYKAHSFGIGANTMVAVTGDNFLAFKNVGGYLSLRLYGDNISVRRITLKSNGGEKIAGEASITMPLGGLPEVVVAGSGTDAISLVCDPAVKLGRSETSYTEFWLVVPPVTMAGGFEITVVDDMGGVYTKKTTKSYTVTRNTLDWMKELKVEPDYDNVGIEFDDDNFEAFCLSNYDSNHDGVVTGAEVENIKVVNVSTDNIRSIKGIEFFASLEQLTCRGSLMQTKSAMQTKSGSYGGQLETIDVSKNVHLWELDCSGNKLEEVDVSNNPNLQTLICTDNPIEEVILAPDQVVATLESPVESNIVYEWDDEVEDTQGADEIWYTTSNGSLVIPADNVFGDVTIVSNTYVDGKGVIKFSGPLKYIGMSAFGLAEGHNYLTSVTLPEGLTTIDGYAFGYCTSMVSITFPSTLETLGYHAIRDCYSLTYVTLPQSLTEISDACFDNCSSLKAFQGPYASEDHKCLIKDGRLIAIAIPYGTAPSFTIPSGVTGIGDYVFHFRNDFTDITIPEGVKEIGSSFASCSSLTSVTIPESVTSIERGAFTECLSLQEFNGKFASDDHRCLVVDGMTVGFAPAGLTEYTIPSNVTYVAYCTFESCDELTSITIPESVNRIGSYAFNYCSALTSIVIESETPPVLEVSTIFDGTNDCPIYVPASAVETYKKASTYWERYAGRIAAMPSGAVPADFPDESFRAYVFENFDSNKDGKLSAEECDAVIQINVCTDTIATVQGIEFFQNLSYLNCAGTNTYNNGSFVFNGLLTSLDVTRNTALQGLICDNNQLSSLDVTNNPVLESLHCHGNQLTSLDVSNNAELGMLSCGYNQLTSLDLSNNPALYYLSSNSNQLTSLDVSNNTALETLGFNNNQVTGIDLSNNTALNSLDCAYNQLTSFDVTANTALKWLQCDGNSFTQLDVSHNIALQSLVCRNTPLTTLNVSNNPALSTLWCSSNTLSTLYLATGQEIASLKKSADTEIVYLIAPASFPDENFRAYVFSNFDTDGNNILSDAECDAVEAIDVVTDNIASLQGIHFFQNLSSLKCNGGSWMGGALSSLDVSANQSLTTLWCRSNQLTELIISSNTALSDLRCSANKLSTLDVSNNTNLLLLACGSNQLTSLDVSHNTALRTLQCEANQLSTIDLSNNTQLDYLACYYNNKMTTLDLSHNPSLYNLMCYGCQLTSLDVSSNPQLQYFRCNGNNLTELDVSNNLSLKQLYCNDNPMTTLYLATGQVISELSKNDDTEIVYKDFPVPEVVDLGLSVKWASFNLGASSPRGYGSYYAWGETTPKDTYSWENYAWCKGAEKTLTKYCYDSEYGFEGFVDNKRSLDLADDAAYANLGSGFRTPTCADWKELFDNTTHEWTTDYQGSGIPGYILTSTVSGYTSSSIFLPCAGYYWGYQGRVGKYMSSEQQSCAPTGFDTVYFEPDGYIAGCSYQNLVSIGSRYEGCTIRPVYVN